MKLQRNNLQNSITKKKYVYEPSPPPLFLETEQGTARGEGQAPDVPRGKGGPGPRAVIAVQGEDSPRAHHQGPA